jgi:cytochrome c peroxidase
VLFPVSVGAFDTLLGNRNAPTIMYMRFSPRFHFALEREGQGDEPEYTPTGGQFWDGRADTLAQQAQGPILNPREMAMPDKAAVATQIAAADYAPLLRSIYGDSSSDVDATYEAVADAIAVFESTDDFAPFSSKFDAVLLSEAEFTPQEQRGFELFKDPKKGNCIACHAGDPDSQRPRDWLFTDFTYDNLGVPRNPEIPDNEDPDFFDLGLCQSPGIADRAADIPNASKFVDSLCGSFKVPTLRNVALTAPYMHNGRFTKLRDVVDFYVTRDTEPSKWYPAGEDGVVHKFDDLPAPYRANVNTEEVPYDRHLGQQPHLSPDEIDAVVAFLQTLTDGYGPE